MSGSKGQEIVYTWARLNTPTHKELSDTIDAALRRAKAAGDAEIARLKAELNTPEVVDFVKAVNLEAAHQRERWGSEHDSSKTDADWFWLVGYLVGKALHKPEKRLHHLITAGAALANWHLSTLGKTNMRPGIDARAAQIEEGE